MTASDSLGQDWSYVQRLPTGAIIAGGQYARLTIKAALGAALTVSGMSLGIAADTGVSFSAGYQQITVGGATAFSVPAGSSVVTDPAYIDVSQGDVLIAYDLASGSGYPMAAGAGSLSYKAGSGLSGIQAKTGYSTIAYTRAVVTQIEASPAAEAGATPSAPASEAVIASVLAGERYSAGADAPDSAGNIVAAYLTNPAGSGKMVMLYRVHITAPIDAVVSIRAVPDGAGTSVQPCNVRFSRGPGLGVFRWQHVAASSGGLHAIYRAKAGDPFVIESDAPLVALDPGVTLGIFVAASSSTINVEWREIGG
jgi:hypothetical protein